MYRPFAGMATVFFLFIYSGTQLNGQPAQRASPADVARLAYEQCGEQWGVPGAIANCLLAEEERIGRLLASIYEKAMKSLSQAPQNLLRESQKGWLIYQSKYCGLIQDLPSIVREGSGFGKLSRAECMLSTTLQRFDELERLIQP